MMFQTFSPRPLRAPRSPVDAIARDAVVRRGSLKNETANRGAPGGLALPDKGLKRV